MADDEFDLFFPMKSFRKQMRNMFSGMFSGMPDLGLKDLRFKDYRQPLIDIADKGDELEIVAELPGINKKDVDINVTEDTLILKARNKSEQKKVDKEKGYYYRERGYSSFVRSIALPAEVMPNKTKADFNNGILTIRLKKKHPEHKKERGFKVPIK